MRYLNQVELKDQRVLVRADFNVPLDSELKITDDNRIKQFLPTLRHIVECGGKAILMSHLGDPNGARDPKSSLKPVVERLSTLMGVSVQLAPDCIGPEVEKLVAALPSGGILLLENLRFHKGEVENDPAFATNLAKLGDVYVNDAFATAHRAHASMVGLPNLMTTKCAGLLMQKELDYAERALKTPKHPLCVILGGSKTSTKLAALLNIANKADKIIIGGAMANTFLAAQGIQIGKSLVERELFPQVVKLLADLARRDCKLYLPVDFMVGPSLSAKGVARAVPAQEMPPDSMALDIGPATCLLYKEAIQTAETIIWNGPMGAFEQEDYANGTNSLIESLAQVHGLTVVGGGDTDSAIHAMGLAHKFGYISTGGGAFLYILEGKSLPALRALE